MKKIKFKKDIPADVFVLTLNDGEYFASTFNKKMKVSEIYSENKEMFIFESLDDAMAFLNKEDKELASMDFEKFEKFTGHKFDSSVKRKKNHGRYNRPIILNFELEDQGLSLEFARDFLKHVRFGEISNNYGDAVVVEVYKKSKGSVMNKLKKFKRLGYLNFINYGELVSITE